MACGRSASALGVLTLSLAVFSADSQSIDGFLHLRWGSARADIERTISLTPSREEGTTSHFAADLTTFDGIDITGCEMEFIGDRLAGVFFVTQGPVNSHRLTLFLDRKYGPGRRENPSAIQWFGPDSHIAFDEDSAGNAYVYWYSLRQFGTRPDGR